MYIKFCPVKGLSDSLIQLFSIKCMVAVLLNDPTTFHNNILFGLITTINVNPFLNIP